MQLSDGRELQADLEWSEGITPVCYGEGDDRVGYDPRCRYCARFIKFPDAISHRSETATALGRPCTCSRCGPVKPIDIGFF
jgi:hypothetical protein